MPNKTFKLSTSGCWSLQFLKKALKCTSVINGSVYKEQHLLCKTDLQRWGKLHERIILDCPLTSCLNHLGRA